MDLRQTILGPILNPRPGGSVDFLADGALECDENGIITYIGQRNASHSSFITHHSSFILPPFLDAHIHIPQHPIRGHFMDNIGENPPQGRLLAGLNANVFPAEAKCANTEYAEQVVDEFVRETLSQGVVGGAAYVTIHPDASAIALSKLGGHWSAGLVLMEMNCPEYLRVFAKKIESQMRELADRFRGRYIVTDRFAVAVGSKLRRAAVRVAEEFGLRMQTHLNEQVREKEFVEKTLYPDADSYTDVYARDGLLDHSPILAHCIHMTPAEWDLVQRTNAVIAHCPTSNTLLCSGIMQLDELHARGIPYAICTDVGASPTTSMLAEMAQFLKLHAGRSKHATPSQALYRTTLAAAKILNIDHRIGTFEVGKPMSFIEVAASGSDFKDADDAIARGLLNVDLDTRQPGLNRLASNQLDVGPELDALERDIRETAARLEHKVISVTLAGRKIFSRS